MQCPGNITQVCGHREPIANENYLLYKSVYEIHCNNMVNYSSVNTEFGDNKGLISKALIEYNSNLFTDFQNSFK